jgi:polysaccharide export outer membrane protein
MERAQAVHDLLQSNAATREDFMAFARGLLAVGILSLAACAHGRTEAKDEAASSAAFALSREDVIEVSVWKEPELSRAVPIRPDGKIALPLVGEMQAEGLTPNQLEANITKALQPLVRDPRVSVIVRDVNGRRVFVTGMVTRPGAFPLRSDLTVLQALAMAGGLAEFADRGDIRILRADGKHVVVSYDDLVDGKKRIALSSGDTVVVP